MNIRSHVLATHVANQAIPEGRGCLPGTISTLILPTLFEKLLTGQLHNHHNRNVVT